MNDYIIYMTSTTINYTSPEVTELSFASSSTQTAQHYYRFQQPIRFSRNRQYGLRVKDASISAYLVNIQRNLNSMIEYSLNDGVTWDGIDLETGNYSLSQINNSINAVLNQYYTDINQPAFSIKLNSALYRAYSIIDNTKLNVLGGVLKINLGASRIWEILGFEDDTELEEGLTEAPHIMKIDYYGNACDVFIGGISSSLSIYNGKNSNFVCRIPFVGSQLNEYTYVNQSNTYIPIIGIPEELEGFNIDVKSKDGKHIKIMSGSFSITLEITTM
jgi:hypothetical protein